MFGRLFIFIGLLVTVASPAYVQASDPRLPEPCRGNASEELDVLEKRKRAVERSIAEQMEVAGGKGQVQPATTLHKDQQSLLKLLVQIECLKAQERVQSVRGRARRAFSKAAKPAANAIEVTTYYATNRNSSGQIAPARVYGSGVEAKLQYGRAVVSIPITHTPGNIELPSLWKLEFTPDPSRHFVLKSVLPLGTDAARKELTEKLGASGSKALLLFVHGYNTDFREAALRTAQLAHDLEFQGVPFFFSWPSAAQLLAYLQDAETAQLSEGAFGHLLDDLSQLPVDGIYIVAHSMGNRIVSQALRARVERGRETSHIREVLLAAPDINADLFRTVIAPKLAAMQGTKTTVYASSFDLALMASKVVHGFRRVGETTGGVLVYPGLETIDASGGSFLTRGYGHSYLTDSPSVLKDIASIIRRRLSARQRGLSEAGLSPNTFWKLAP